MVDIATLGIEVRSESLLRASQDLDKFAGATQRVEQRMQGFSTGTTAMNGALNRLSNSVQNAGRVMNGFNNALQLLGLGIAANEIKQYADSWTRMGNKITTASQASGVQARSLESIRQSADNARIGMEAYIDLYARIMRSSKGVIKSEQEVTDVTDTVSKAFAIAGATAAEQAAGVLQLSQALGSGVLQGDELRSLRENSPVLMQAIAEEFGTTISGLKQLGAEGKLTTDRLVKAILSAKSQIDAQFNSTSSTIEQSLTIVKNAATQFIGVTDKMTGSSKIITQSLKGIAEHFELIGNSVLAIGGIAFAKIFGPMIANVGTAVASQIKLSTAVLEGNAVMLNSRTAILQKANAAKEAAIADQMAAKAALELARAEAVKAKARLDANAANQGTIFLNTPQGKAFSQDLSERHSQALADLAQKEQAYANATAIAANKTDLANKAMKNATTTARVLGGAMSLASKAMAAVGGPMGVAILAVGTAMYFSAKNAQEAQERADRYSEAIKRAGEQSGQAAPNIQEASKAFFSVANNATYAENAAALKKTKDDLHETINQMEKDLNSFATRQSYKASIAISPENLWGNAPEGSTDTIIRQLMKLNDQFKEGCISAEAYIETYNKLTKNNPDLTGFETFAAAMQQQARLADAARGKIEALRDQMNGINGLYGPKIDGFNKEQEKQKKLDDYVKEHEKFSKLPKDQRDLINRTNYYKKQQLPDGTQIDDEHAQQLAILDRDRDKRDAASKKSTKFSLQEANAYRDLIKSGEDRVAQLELEAQVAGKAGVAADTLRMKLELEQKATDKGRVITAQKRQEIDKLVDSYQKAAEATARAKIQADVMNERQTLGLSTIEQAVSGRMQSAGLLYGSDPQLEAAIRYNEQIKVGMGLTTSLMNSVSSAALNGTSALNSLGNAFKNIANQLMEMATQELVANAFRPLLSGGQSSKKSGGFFGNIFGGFLGGGSDKTFQLGTPQGFASNNLANALANGDAGFFAKGGAFGTTTRMFAKGGTFTNSIVNSPTPFKFADGDAFSAGVMGEAGPEAVMPLKRDAKGALGVAVNGFSRPQQTPQQEQKTVVVHVEPSEYFNVRVQEIASEVSKSNIKNYDNSLNYTIGTKIDNARKNNRAGTW